MFYFDVVNYLVSVYLNGILLGKYEGGFIFF